MAWAAYILALEPAGQPALGHHRPPCSQQGTSGSPRELAATTSQEQQRSSSFRRRCIHNTIKIVISRDNRHKLKYLLKGLWCSLLAAFLGRLILGVQLHCHKSHLLHKACNFGHRQVRSCRIQSNFKKSKGNKSSPTDHRTFFFTRPDF